MKTNAMRILEENKIKYVEKPHSKKVFTSQEAADQRGVRLSQIVKTMIIEKSGGDCIVALIPGDKRLDLKKLKKVAGDNKLKLISKERVFPTTGYHPGAVSPVGMRKQLSIFCDENVLNEKFIDISSGKPDAGIEMRSSDLLRLLSAHICDITS